MRQPQQQKNGAVGELKYSVTNSKRCPVAFLQVYLLNANAFRGTRLHILPPLLYTRTAWGKNRTDYSPFTIARRSQRKWIPGKSTLWW